MATIPTASIIVPIYNAEQYLSHCINCILVQTFTDFELLLIDDGSTDNSGKICDEYAKKDSRIQVFHKKNGGASSARNLGLDKAKGKWISFVDSDDWVKKEYLQWIVDEEDIADLTFFGCNCCYEDMSQTCYTPVGLYSKTKDSIEECLYRLKYNPQHFEYLGYTWNKLFKASIIKEYHIRFIEDLALREDELFTLSYARYINSLRILPVPLYYYRITLSSLTHKKKDASEYYLLWTNLEKIMQEYKDPNLLVVEYSCIIQYLIQQSLCYKLFSMNWFWCTHTLFKFCRHHQTLQFSSNSKLVTLWLKYKNTIYRYIILILYRLKNYS